jgi:hypothetical protein
MRFAVEWDGFKILWVVIALNHARSLGRPNPDLRVDATWWNASVVT